MGGAAVDAGLTLSDLGLQAGDKLTENIQALPDVNLGAVGALAKGVTFVGLRISGYRTFFGSTTQTREQAASSLDVLQLASEVRRSERPTMVPAGSAGAWSFPRARRAKVFADVNLGAIKVLGKGVAAGIVVERRRMLSAKTPEERVA